jgi:hypothetical protein
VCEFVCGGVYFQLLQLVLQEFEAKKKSTAASPAGNRHAERIWQWIIGRRIGDGVRPIGISTAL